MNFYRYSDSVQGGTPFVEGSDFPNISERFVGPSSLLGAVKFRVSRYFREKMSHSLFTGFVEIRETFPIHSFYIPMIPLSC